MFVFSLNRSIFVYSGDLVDNRVEIAFDTFLISVIGV